jgi:hypothetical protein
LAGVRIWIIAAIVALGPLAVVAATSRPHPRLADVIGALAAGALPGLYFGLTGRFLRGQTWRMTVLSVLSKFAATVMVSFALAVIAEASVFGLLVAVPVAGAAMVIAFGTYLLQQDQPLGVLPLLVTYLAVGVVCLRWHFSANIDNTAIHSVGAVAIAVVCCAAVLGAAEFRARR